MIDVEKSNGFMMRNGISVLDALQGEVSVSSEIFLYYSRDAHISGSSLHHVLSFLCDVSAGEE